VGLVGWVDPVQLKAEWWDAPEEPELSNLLGVAYEVCLAYAPQPVPATIPASWAMAQKLQAKHLYARDKAGNAASIGPDGYQVSTFPLVLEARTLLRPRRSPFAGLL
jgi:hypothetical protein